MKKQLLLLVMMLLPMMAMADAVEIDGIYYNLITKGKIAEVTNNPNKYSGSVAIPEKVQYEGTEYSVTSIGNRAFSDCYGLTSVTIGNNVTSIGDWAFSWCSGLPSITVPNSVTSIGNDAFAFCSGLQKVIVKDIAAWCGISFSGTSSNPLYYAHRLYSDENTEITELIIPNSLTSIGYAAFYGCAGLTSITIPNSVTSIGNSAFSGCSGLTSITIGNSVTSIGAYAFTACSGLTSITIPNSVTSIGESAFFRCSGLTSITIGNSVKSIGDKAFQYCSGLTSITIGNSVMSIGNAAFSGCIGLTSITIPNSVTSIGNAAFLNCSGLTSITIGSGVKSVSYHAFASCTELTDVYCYAENVPSTSTDAFEGSYIEYATLHVPTTSIDAYKSNEPWSNFKIIMGLDGTTPETQKCAKPTIRYNNGQISFGCDTEGVEFVSSITDNDIKSYATSTIQLSVTYIITVYANKSGYQNSETATATLCWIDKEPQTEGITNGVAQIPAKAVLIQSEGGMLTIQGVDDGTLVNVYSANGTQAGSAFSQSGQAVVATNLQAGSVAIVKIGEKAVKVVIK